MATVDLAAASLGAAAPVPPAQAPTSQSASGFADVLAGCTGGDGCDAPTTDTRKALDAGGQRAWDALERLARQFALSSALPASALGEPKAARAVAAGPVPGTGSIPLDEDVEEGTGTTVCVVPEAFLFVPMKETATTLISDEAGQPAGTMGESSDGTAGHVQDSGPWPTATLSRTA